MPLLRKLCCALLLLPLIGTAAGDPNEEAKKKNEEWMSGWRDYINVGDEKAFVDIQDALSSKRYIHNSALQSTVDNTTQFRFGRIYLNHIMGFNAVWQRAIPNSPFAKFTSAVQGLSLGYVGETGHAGEVGLELSAVSSLFGAYRHFFRPDFTRLWPYVGVGLGYELTFLRLSDGPFENDNYNGKRVMGFASLGFLVPLVDIGIKVEARAVFYGTDRLVFTQGLGAILFF